MTAAGQLAQPPLFQRGETIFPGGNEMKENQNGQENGNRPDITTRVVLNSTQQPPDESATRTHAPPSQTAPRASGYQSLQGITAELHEGMFEQGFRRAVDGGDVEPHEDDVEAIRTHAEKAARECTRDP